MLVTGCRLGVAADVELEADGAAEVMLAFHLDEALLAELDGLEVDPTAELTAAVVEDDDWELDRAAVGEALVLTLRRTVEDPARIGEVFRELAAGLADEDPALLVDIEVELADDGRSTVTGTVGFRPPATAGAAIDGEPVGPHGDELAAIVERALVPRFAVTLPGRISASDADEVDGATARWQVPVGTERDVSARAEPAPWWVVHALWLWGAGASVFLVAVAVLAWWVRRRRRRRRAASVSWV